jgi:predicted CopG family antitoxin
MAGTGINESVKDVIFKLCEKLKKEKTEHCYLIFSRSQAELAGKFKKKYTELRNKEL